VVATGPAMKLARSRTRRPSSGKCPLIDVFLSNP
jgi:hypothetical protein